MSGYAIEIAMKSLWALDNTPQRVPHEHSLVVIFDGLKKETAESLKRLQLTRKDVRKVAQAICQQQILDGRTRQGHYGLSTAVSEVSYSVATRQDRRNEKDTDWDAVVVLRCSGFHLSTAGGNSSGKMRQPLSR